MIPTPQLEQAESNPLSVGKCHLALSRKKNLSWERGVGTYGCALGLQDFPVPPLHPRRRMLAALPNAHPHLPPKKSDPLSFFLSKKSRKAAP